MTYSGSPVVQSQFYIVSQSILRFTNSDFSSILQCISLLNNRCYSTLIQLFLLAFCSFNPTQFELMPSLQLVTHQVSTLTNSIYYFVRSCLVTAQRKQLQKFLAVQVTFVYKPLGYSYAKCTVVCAVKICDNTALRLLQLLKTNPLGEVTIVQI